MYLPGHFSGISLERREMQGGGEIEHREDLRGENFKALKRQRKKKSFDEENRRKPLH